MRSDRRKMLKLAMRRCKEVIDGTKYGSGPAILYCALLTYAIKYTDKRAKGERPGRSRPTRTSGPR